MDEKIRCSVAMATYNGEMYIEEQIESVLNNMEENDELIISDDGSSDNTQKIIQSFIQKDSRIKCVNGPRKGIIKNFENALKYTSGEIIFLCDQDDVWEEDKIKKVISALEFGINLVIHDAVVFTEDDVIFPSFMQYRGSKKGFLNNIIKNSYIGCCMAFRREVLDYVLPFPEKICMHDQWIGLISELLGQNRYMEDKLIRYRRHVNNASPMTGNGFWKKIENRANMLMALAERMKLIKQMRKENS